MGFSILSNPQIFKSYFIQNRLSGVFEHEYFCTEKLHTLYIVSCLVVVIFPGIVRYIYRCGPLTAVLMGYSMESDGVCGGVIYN